MEKILIIDDSIVHAHYLKSILEDSYEISLAHTANDGLQYAKTFWMSSCRRWTALYY